MPSDRTREIVQRAYAAYGRGDAPAFLALLHDDIDWMISVPLQVFPFGGPRKGASAVRDALTQLGALYQLESFQPATVLADGERAAAVIHATFRQRSSGRMLSVRVADFLRVQDGLITEFREFIDTFDAVEQAIGQWLTVPAVIDAR